MGAGADRVTFLQNKLVPATIERWSSMLSTIPVQGNLFSYRDCAYYYTSPRPALCAQFADVTTCANTPDDEPITFTSDLLGRQFNYSYRSGSASSISSYNQVEQLAGAGVADADFVIFVTAKQTPRCGSAGSGVLAYASTCQRDQFDRPTWGRVNFCPSNLNSADDAWGSQYGVALHEFAHALGFSASSWPLYRNADANRTPRTPRSTIYPNEPAPTYQTQYTCQGGTYTDFRPANNTVAYFNERGMSCAEPNYIPPIYRATSDCVHKAVGSEVLKVARDFFACPTLNGVELENQLTSPCDVMGSHWEQRILSTELMASYTQHVMLVSPLTLAMLADSGWYTANYSAADAWRPGLDWGFRQGCSFATDKCLSSSGVGLGTPAHFHSTNKGIGTGNGVCTTDRRAVGYVAVADYSSSLPTQYQYYSGYPQRGGNSVDTMDYCPGIVAYSNRRCWSTADGAAYSSKGNYGETFGPNAACFETSLRMTGLSQGPGAGCFQYQCSSATSLTVTVRNSGGTTQTVTCTSSETGASKTVSGYSGSLQCPDVSALCSGQSYKLDPAVSPPPLPSPSASATPPAARPSASPSRAPDQVALVMNFTFAGMTANQVMNSTAGAGLRDQFINDLSTAMMVPTAALFIRAVRDRSTNTVVRFAWSSGAFSNQAVILFIGPASSSSSASGSVAMAGVTQEAVDPAAEKVQSKAFYASWARTAASAAPEAPGQARMLQSGPSGSGVDILVAYRVAVAEPSPDPARGTTGTNVGDQQVQDRVVLAIQRLAAAMGVNSNTSSFTLASPAFANTVSSQCAVAYPGQSLTSSSPACQALAAISGSALIDSNVGVVPADGNAAASPSSGAKASAGLPTMTILIAAIVGAVVVICLAGACAYWCCVGRRRDDKPVLASVPAQPHVLGRPVGPGAVPYVPQGGAPAAGYGYPPRPSQQAQMYAPTNVYGGNPYVPSNGGTPAYYPQMGPQRTTTGYTTAYATYSGPTGGAGYAPAYGQSQGQYGQGQYSQYPPQGYTANPIR